MKSAHIKIVMLVVIVLVVIGAGAAYLFRPVAKLPEAKTIDTTGQPVTGNVNATIRIVAFEDLKCGNCMRYNVQLLPKIMQRYVNTGQASYTVVNLAFIPGSMPAANAARCLYHQKKDFFFKFAHYVYHHQPSEMNNWATLPRLMQYASHIPGVNTQKLSQCIAASPYNKFINGNMKIAQKVMGPTVATPSLYINGHVVKPLTMQRVNQLIRALK